MSVLGYDPDDLFVVRTIKHLTANPSNKWANSYEFQAVDAGATETLLTLASALITWEAAIHTEAVTFDRVIVSTWQPDSVPYDPAAFLSTTVTQLGLRSDVPNEVVPIGEALRVTRQVSSGRFGNLFYRGALFENEVSQPAGIPILTSPGSIQDTMDDALTPSGLDDFIGISATGGLIMVMVDAAGANVRVVNALAASGVSLIKSDHQWFNRT